MIKRLLIAYAIVLAFAAGVAVRAIYDSSRVATAAAEARYARDAYYKLLMELELYGVEP